MAHKAMKQMWWRLGAAMMATGIALGAFGAHALAGAVTAARLDVWDTAVFYHLVHALACLAMAAAGEDLPVTWQRRLAVAVITGTVLFSGSLYVLVLSDVRWFGLITPLGGTVWIVGWLALAIRRPRA